MQPLAQTGYAPPFVFCPRRVETPIRSSGLYLRHRGVLAGWHIAQLPGIRCQLRKAQTPK